MPSSRRFTGGDYDIKAFEYSVNRWRIIAAAAILLAGLISWLVFSFWQVAPSRAVSSRGTGEGGQVGLEKLHVRLGWLANANSAGQIVAAAKGYYHDEGLDVIFREGGMVDPSVKTVASGEDDVGFANGPDLVISARAAGAPLKIVAVIQREGYHGFFVRDDSVIQTPKDWIGRRVGVKLGSPTYLYYQAILGKLGIERSGIHEVPVTYDLRLFLAGEVDIYPGAKNNEAIALEAQGIRLKCFSPVDYGIPTMGNVLFANETTLHKRRDTVRRFVHATMKGWDWCRIPEHQNAAIDYLVAYSQRLDAANEFRALNMTLPFVGNGDVDRNKLAAIIDMQFRFGGLSRRVSVAEVTDSVTTN